MIAWGFAHAISDSDMEIKLNKIYPQKDGSFSRGYIGLNSGGISGSTSPVTTDTQWANFKSRYLVQSPMGKVAVDDGFKFGKAALKPGILNAAKNGFKGLTGGVPGLVGQIIGTIVLNEMISKGFQWMDDAKNYYKTPTPDANSNKIPSDKWSLTRQYCGTSYNNGPSDWATYYGALVYQTWPYTPGYYIYCSYTASWLVAGYYKPTSGYYLGSTAPDCPSGYTFTSNTCMPGSRPATVDDVETAVNNAIDAKWPQIAQGAVDDGEVIQVPKTTVINVPTQEPMYPPPQVTTTTGTDANGNPVTKVKTTQPKVVADPGTTVADPIKTKTSEDSTTQTRTCDQTGANCSTKTDTESTSPKTDKPDDMFCAINPSSVACLDVGSLPSSGDLPTQTVNIPFNQVSFSLPTTCPAPIPIVTHRGTYQFSFEFICQYAAGIRYLFLLVCSIGAYFIVAGSLQRKTA